MNRVHNSIKNNIVQPAIQNIATPTIGIIRSFHSLSQTANIAIANPSGKTERIMKNVPFLSFNGIKQADPMPGDNVLVIFMDGSYRQPVVLGKVEIMHTLTTRNAKESHFRAGGNATDIYSMREGEFWNDRGLI